MNSNVMPDDLREKLRVHIRTTGKYPAIIVRNHPDLAGAYQILDGHNRTSLLRELGHTEIVCDVWEVTEGEALVLMATLNRLEGSDEPALRARLLHEIEGHLSRREMSGLLPESEREIADLQFLLEFPAEDVVEASRREVQRHRDESPVVIHFIVTKDQAATIDAAIQIASDGERGRDLKAKGLYQIALTFLASRNAGVAPNGHDAGPPAPVEVAS